MPGWFKNNVHKQPTLYLAEELIDNAYDMAGKRQASRRSRGETSGYPERNHTVVADNGMLRSGAALHLTPTKKI